MIVDKQQIDGQILELKDEYVQLQNNLDKLESIGGNLAPLEKRLSDIEVELKELNARKQELS